MRNAARCLIHWNGSAATAHGNRRASSCDSPPTARQVCKTQQDPIAHSEPTDTSPFSWQVRACGVACGGKRRAPLAPVGRWAYASEEWGMVSGSRDCIRTHMDGLRVIAPCHSNQILFFLMCIWPLRPHTCVGVVLFVF